MAKVKSVRGRPKKKTIGKAAISHISYGADLSADKSKKETNKNIKLLISSQHKEKLSLVKAISTEIRLLANAHKVQLEALYL